MHDFLAVSNENLTVSSDKIEIMFYGFESIIRRKTRPKTSLYCDILQV